MASKNLTDRFQEAFKDPESAHAQEYQKIVEAITNKISNDVEKSLLLLVGFIIMFVLIVEKQIGSIKFENIELTDFSVIAILIPLVFSYTHFNLITCISKFDHLSILYKIIVKQRHKPIYDQRLTEFFLITPNLYDYKYFSSNKSIQVVQFILWAIQFFSVTIVIPFAFQVYAFANLFALSKPNHFALIVMSLAITVVFGLQSFLTVMTLLRETTGK
jgi:hypothetical protein